jgi:hypothetical protein
MTEPLREAAREAIETLPAATAAGNVDAASDGLDVEFDDNKDGTSDNGAASG